MERLRFTSSQAWTQEVRAFASARYVSMVLVHLVGTTTYSGWHSGDSIGEAWRGLGTGEARGETIGLPSGVGD